MSKCDLVRVPSFWPEDIEFWCVPSFLYFCTFGIAGAVRPIASAIAKSTKVLGTYRYPQSLSQSVAALTINSVYVYITTPPVKYGTVQKSNLAKWRQDDVCCRRAIRRWNAETVTFPFNVRYA